MNTKFSQLIMLSSIAMIQIIDIVIHAATYQLEAIRVISNALILIWLIMLIFKQVPVEKLHNFIVIGIYMALNIIFLALGGLINEANGNLRIPLFVLVGTTIIISTIYTIKNEAKKD